MKIILQHFAHGGLVDECVQRLRVVSVIRAHGWLFPGRVAVCGRSSSFRPFNIVEGEFRIRTINNERVQRKEERMLIAEGSRAARTI
jgi:hypothetical protein